MGFHFDFLWGKKQTARCFHKQNYTLGKIVDIISSLNLFKMSYLSSESSCAQTPIFHKSKKMCLAG